MSAGYAGKILYVDLTTRKTRIIHTGDYLDWGGGHGMGSALFWDLVVEQGDWDMMDGFDPRNLITIMASPLSGTLTPGCSGRCELQGVGVQQYPTGWYTRSNFGGRFSSMLKNAGWDGMAIQGAADAPVWINIKNDKVKIEDASSLWGLDTWETQLQIWNAASGESRFGEWYEMENGQTTQRPAVLCVGPTGESKSRMGCLIHETGYAVGQGGFGGVWGSKNLKAVSIIGSGSVDIADPKALLDARLWMERNFSWGNKSKPSANGCFGCNRLCQGRDNHFGTNGSMCLDLLWYMPWLTYIENTETNAPERATELCQRYGINICELASLMSRDPKGGWILNLYDAGIFGPGLEIDSDPLPMDRLGSKEFVEMLIRSITKKIGIGAYLHDGVIRAAIALGREQDLSNGMLNLPQYGYAYHWALPKAEWSYGSVLGDRDINEHDFSYGIPPIKGLPAEDYVNLAASKMVPYEGDPFMFDWSWQGEDGSNMDRALETGIYSIHHAKLTAWHRHYSRFKQSIGFCDYMWMRIIHENGKDYNGYTPEGEPRFFNAVTGKNKTFTDLFEMGRRIWNLDRAIWILQGRHRDTEKLAGFMFKPGAAKPDDPCSVYTDEGWKFDTKLETYLDETGFETAKTRFYEFEGWDPDSGWPSRSTLKDLNLDYVADKLESAGKLGAKGTYQGF